MIQENLGFRVLIPLDKSVKILDQTRLPSEVVYNKYDDYIDIIGAIKRLEIRGAPAIAGISEDPVSAQLGTGTVYSKGVIR